MPLMHLAEKQARICIYNSPLSEAAVLGFDYGYSLDYPKMLCLWEAQFGDFSNGAQTIIDQFIVSAESKWQRPSGIVLLLPHGYEGQGPEHSSARLERFLQACADDNIQVCNLTTAAQYFHVLRRQMKRDFIKPLIIMTPKSLLRAKFASSPADEFTQGRFEEILGSPEVGASAKVKRIILCSGKVYYDLLNYRTQTQDRGCSDHSDRAALSARGKEAARNAQAISKECEDRLVPGRTGKHGRMDVHRTAVAHNFLHRNCLRGSRSQRQPGRRRAGSTQTRTGPLGRRCVFSLRAHFHMSR